MTMGSWQVMVVGVLLCALSSFSLVHSAPTLLKSPNDVANADAKFTSQTELTNEKPVVRTKRAEEILYGNHQNAARVKKSDPAATVDGQDKTKTGEDDIKTNADTLPQEDDTSHAEKQSIPVDKQSEKEDDATNVQNNLENIPIEADEVDYPKYEVSSDDVTQQQETTRKRRSTKPAALMTAENMVASSNVASVAKRPVRAKRDLDYEELRELLENSREVPYALEDDSGPVAVIPMLPETSSEGEEEEEEEVDNGEDGPISVAIPYPYDPRYDISSEKEELIRELVEKKAEEEAKEKLIDRLLAAVIASDPESPATDDDDDDDGEEVDDEGRFGPLDSDEENGDDPVAIGPVAVKRNVFYPYSYEPYDGRWGPLVPGAKRRNADDYERLYRLAEALNADDEDYEEKK